MLMTNPGAETDRAAALVLLDEWVIREGITWMGRTNK